MTPLGANLRHLYQRKGMWLLYTLLILTTVPSAIFIVNISYGGSLSGGSRGMFAFPLLTVLFAGMYVADHVSAILACPLSFCLPNHQRLARRFLGLVGVSVSLLAAMAFMAYPGLDWPMRAMALAGAFCLNLACYALGTITVSTGSRLLGGLVGWIWVVGLAGAYFGLHIAMVDAVTHGNLGFMGACLLIAGLIWLKWGNRDLARRLCGNPRLGSFGAWDPDKIRRMAQVRWAAKQTKVGRSMATLTERFVLARMGEHAPLSDARTVWGGLYQAFGGIAAAGPGFVIAAALMAIYFGYIGTQMSWFMFAFVSIMAGSSIQLSIYSVLPVPQGRRERTLVGIALAIAACVFAVTLLGAAVLASHLVGPVVPNIALDGAVFKFHVMQPSGLWVPWAILPAMQAVRLIWPKRGQIIAIVCFATVSFVLSPLIIAAMGKGGLPGWTVPAVVAMIIASWSLFIGVLRWASLRRDLVIQ